VKNPWVYIIKGK